MFYPQFNANRGKPIARTGSTRFPVVVLIVIGIGLGYAGHLRAALAADGERRPNVLYIMTDQQHAGMLSCAGNPYLKTPAMDSLAATGTRFEKAYATNPVCLPSRVSMMTGYLPSHFGIRSNADARGPIAEEILSRSMGWIFRKAGYETAYGGKTHWPKGMTVQSLGFQTLTGNDRDELAQECVRFIQAKHDRPFLLVASFINPHDICYMAIDDHTRATKKEAMYPKSTEARKQLAAALQLPEGISREEFFRGVCPPLPENHEIPALEPECISTEYVKARTFRNYARENWSDEQWRLHRWAYCRLTERVDGQVGLLLAALRGAGLEERTVIVFSSDHGDMDSAHRLEHKSILYEEAVRVPFIVSYKGVTRPGLVDTAHLVSAGLDLIPTLCDFAGIDPPAELPGRSVKPLCSGRSPDAWRSELVVESQAGRMLRTERYKYNRYDSGAHREQLIDLEEDPGEMVNLAENADYGEVLERHRRLFDR
jgi:choline-sulfatase